MIIGSISENKDLEKRISITPDIAKKYVANGFQVLLEANYGNHLSISDEEFLRVGCKIEKKENILQQSKIVLQLDLPEEKNFQERPRLLSGSSDKGDEDVEDAQKEVDTGKIVEEAV